jgi:CRP-like cAMP-binding protein
MWRAIYLMKLPGFDRKIRVSTDWFLDLLLPPDIVQLKLEKPTSVTREYFEPHQIIFRQGDRGDRLYIVVDGEVEMLKQDPRQPEQPLARLGPGECFGEMALVNESLRMATARTVTKVNLLSVDRATFNALFASHPPLRSMFQMLIDKRLRMTADDMQTEVLDAQTQVQDARRTQA